MVDTLAIRAARRRAIVRIAGATMLISLAETATGQPVPIPRGFDADPFPPCVLDAATRCQTVEYPIIPARAYASMGAGTANPARVCDHFRTDQGAGAITSVCWWGTYALGVCDAEPPESDDNFVVTYYRRNICGLPREVFAGPFEQRRGELTVTRRTLCDANGRDAAAYSATHAPVAVTPYTCYFIEIRNAGGPYWAWCRAPPLYDASCYRDETGGGYGPADLTVSDRAFCLGTALDIFGTQACLPPVAPQCLCPCDVDHIDGIDSRDFFLFLDEFFVANPSADVNADGLINSQDFFDFLACFFHHPPGCG